MVNNGLRTKVTGPDRKKGITRYPVEKKGRPPAKQQGKDAAGGIYSPADWQEYTERNLASAGSRIRSAIEAPFSMQIN